MQVVDAVKIHVFSVPGKCALPHPKVKVRSVHSLDLDATLPLYCVKDSVQAPNIPLSHILQVGKVQTEEQRSVMVLQKMHNRNPGTSWLDLAVSTHLHNYLS